MVSRNPPGLALTGQPHISVCSAALVVPVGSIDWISKVPRSITNINWCRATICTSHTWGFWRPLEALGNGMTITVRRRTVREGFPGRRCRISDREIEIQVDAWPRV